MSDRFLRQPFQSPTGVAACDEHAFIAAMCRFELAVTEAAEQAGALPAGTHGAMTDAVEAIVFDTTALAVDTPDGGNVAIPFVKQAKAQLPAELAAAFHQGATSQDVIDTALMLLIKPRLARCLALIDEALTGGASVMQTHRDTPMAGRTLTQQALPITFGAKMAGWLNGLIQAEARLRAVHDTGLCLQFGGPVGMHHDIGGGLSRMTRIAEILGLACPALPWHTDRQPILALVDAVGAAGVAAEKIATDVAWMSQTEVGELREPAATGAGGSSSMPHKANPVGSIRIRAAARDIHAAVALCHQAGAQPHERAFGEWHAEWAPLLDAVLCLEGMLETLVPLIGAPIVDSEAMRRNLALPAGANLGRPTRDLLAAYITPEAARDTAARAVAEARATGTDYIECLIVILDELPADQSRPAPEALRRTLDPAAYTGSSAAQVDRIAERIAARHR